MTGQPVEENSAVARQTATRAAVHEIRNQLSILLLNNQEADTISRKATERITFLVEALAILAQGAAGEPQTTDTTPLLPLIQESCDSHVSAFHAKEIALNYPSFSSAYDTAHELTTAHPHTVQIIMALILESYAAKLNTDDTLAITTATSENSLLVLFTASQRLSSETCDIRITTAIAEQFGWQLTFEDGALHLSIHT